MAPLSRKAIVQYKSPKGEWRTAVQRTAIGSGGIYRNDTLEFTGRHRMQDAYLAGQRYAEENRDEPVRMVEVVVTQWETFNPEQAEPDTDVHTEHCCKVHGCKYACGTDCPVENGTKPQSFPCEACEDDG